LLIIVSAHSLVSLTFLHSDEFSQIKVAGEWGFFNKLLIKRTRQTETNSNVHTFAWAASASLRNLS
jgi:hypothetical protein